MRTFQYIVCNDCTHGYCAPLPENFAAGYEDVVDEGYLKYTASRQFSYEHLVRELASNFGPGPVVDIGCATGDFIAATSSAGFPSTGIEPSLWSSKIAQERGFTVHVGFLDDAASESSLKGKFKYASLFGVIEHFEDPSTQVEHLVKLLEDEGYVVIWTGDKDSSSARILGRFWWYWQGQHIQYFTQKSLQKLLELHGFVEFHFSRYPYGATQETIFNSLTRYPRLKFLNPCISFVLNLLPKVWTLKLPGEMLCVAKLGPLKQPTH